MVRSPGLGWTSEEDASCCGKVGRGMQTSWLPWEVGSKAPCLQILQ